MEKILCAAIWYKEIDAEISCAKNIDKGIVITGYRHGQCIAVMKQLKGLRSCINAPDATGDFEQGFLTSKARFVNREEAAKIFLQTGGELIFSKTELYSEDLY